MAFLLAFVCFGFWPAIYWSSSCFFEERKADFILGAEEENVNYCVRKLSKNCVLDSFIKIPPSPTWSLEIGVGIGYHGLWRVFR